MHGIPRQSLFSIRKWHLEEDHHQEEEDRKCRIQVCGVERSDKEKEDGLARAL